MPVIFYMKISYVRGKYYIEISPSTIPYEERERGSTNRLGLHSRAAWRMHL